MTYSRRVTAVAAAVLVALMAAQAVLVRRVDQLRASATLQEVLYIPSPEVVKRLSLGYSGLLADIYWTRAVQYFGGKHHARSTNYQLLLPLLQITTTLDPHLIPAYQFGAIFLAQGGTEGAGLPDEAIKLVDASAFYPQSAVVGGWVTRHDYYQANRNVLQRIIRAVQQLQGTCTTNQVADAGVALASNGGAGALFNDVILLGKVQP